MIDPLTETYVPGETLKKTPFYDGNYPRWKVTEGVVVSVTKGIAHDQSLGKDEKPLYRARYGGQTTYPSFNLLVKGTDGMLYAVSQLGFNREGV
jgi:hypothetical protein